MARYIDLRCSVEPAAAGVCLDITEIELVLEKHLPQKILAYPEDLGNFRG